MEILELKVEKRTTKGKKVMKRLREERQIPAILYGHKLDNVMLCFEEGQFARILNTGARMVRLTFDDKKESVLIKDIQYDYISDRVIHVDFSRIDLDERIRLRIPIELFGESIGVKEGGVLTYVMKDVEVECLPIAIPEKIRVNISDLNLGKAIHVKELPVPEGIQYISDPDAVIVSVHQPASEKVVPEEELLAEPEVITKKPKEGEEAEAKSA